MYSTRPGEEINFAATIQPNAGTAGTFLSEAISLDSGTGRRLFALLQTGAIGASGTVDASLVGATTSGGSYTIAIPGSAIAQDTTGSNIHTITAGIDWVKYVAPTANFVKLKVVTAVAATPFSAVVMGFECSNNPPASASTASARVTSQNVTTLA
jgi:hypothetical protein